MNNFISPQAERSIYQVIIVTFIVCFFVNYFQPKPVSPISAYAMEPELPPTAEIVSYIAKTFEPEGTSVVVWAIRCFYAESKLKTDAYNYNAWNDTDDRGVAQINSIHGLSPEDAQDYKKNIDMAYQVYKKQGTSAWYAQGCN